MKRMSDNFYDVFFKTYPLNSMSAYILFDAQMENLDIINAVSEDLKSDSTQEERLSILHENDPEVLVNMMRGKVGKINYPVLRKKILDLEDVTIPMILTKLKRTLNDVFTEHSVYLIVHAEKNYVQELMGIYDEIRSPYTQSMICYLLGRMGVGEHILEFLFLQHEHFESNYQNEDYSQGPLLGIAKYIEKEEGVDISEYF